MIKDAMIKTCTMRLMTAMLTLGALLMMSTGVAWSADVDRIAVRQSAMKFIGAQMRQLAAMTRGQTAINPPYVAAVGSSLAIIGDSIPILFDDLPDGYPLSDSEALPAIGDNWDAFTAEAARMAAAGRAMAANPDDFSGAFQTLSATCRTCHSQFRE